MALDAAIRRVVAAANKVTASLQATVTHYAWTGRDGYDKPTYAAGVTRTAVVQKTTRWIRQKDDTVKQARLQIRFLSNVAVDVKDKIALADGTTGPILDVSSPLDSASNGYVTEVLIG